MAAVIPRRPRAVEAGVGLVVIGVPLVFSPLSRAPFLDAKLPLAVAGATLVAVGGALLDRSIARAAALWVGAVAAATAFGVDPWWSLLGAESQGAGLVLLAACGLLAAAGPHLDEQLLLRIPRWLAWVTGAVTAVALVQALGLAPGSVLGSGNTGSVLGQDVLVGGLTAAVIAAAAGTAPTRTTSFLAFVAGSGLALSFNRSGAVAAVVGVGVTVWRGRPGRRVALVAGPALVGFALWTLAGPAILPERPSSVAEKFGQIGEGSARARPAVWAAMTRAWRADPVLGRGPGTAWGGFLSRATASEVRRAGRGWGDAHNMPIEAAVTTGTLGLLALGVLAAVIAARSVRAPRDVGWAAGAAAALAVHHLLQPLSVVLTLLLFLTAGIAARAPPTRIRAARPARGWVAVVGAVACALSLGRFAASTFEQYARTYDSEAAFRWSLRLEPPRLGAAQEFAERRALDARAARPGAADEARRLSASTIDAHGWNPGVRLNAAAVEVLLDDQARARTHVDRHLRTFPNDPTALAYAAALALERGDRAGAAAYARRSLDIEESRLARRVLRDAGAG